MVIIDGYNLMYVSQGLSVGKVPSTQFQAKRQAFLEWLANELGPLAKEVRIVFDGMGSPRNLGTTIFRGIIVNYSTHGQTADDVIEALLESPEVQDAKAKVVSNDTRLVKAARRAGCEPMSCEAYMDQLVQLREDRRAGIPVAEHRPRQNDMKPVRDADFERELLHAFTEPKKR
jgi:predicted RNA-binding protein with PIN domain